MRGRMIEPPTTKGGIPSSQHVPPNDPPRDPPGAPPGAPPQGPSEPPEDPTGKPCIFVSPGEGHLAYAETERVLSRTGKYFVSGGALVRLVDRGSSGPAIEQVHEQTLRTLLSAMIDYKRQGRDGLWVRCDVPHGVIQALLHGQDRPYIQEISGFARQPFFRPDGTVVDQSGYDPDTGTYGAFDASRFRLDDPSREHAEHSLEYLRHLLGEFEFASVADESAALGAMFTAAVRPSLSVAPAFIVTATGPGSGKSYLADVVTLFAGSDEPYRVSFPERADEAAKLLVTVLREKPSAVVFDDMQGNWKSLGPLNRALSSPTITERLLGSNRTATASTRVLFMGTGNNVEPERDARRRVVCIALAPRSETPALRKFREDPIATLRKHRTRAVECVLNIIGAYRAAGEPATDVRPIGTYEEWSRLCRQPLIWMGLPDPAQSLIDQVSVDPDREAWGEFLEAWQECFGGRAVTVRMLIAKAEQHPRLMEALEDLPVMDGKSVNRGRLGWLIRKRKGQRVDGLRIEEGDLSERNSWRVVGG